MLPNKTGGTTNAMVASNVCSLSNKVFVFRVDQDTVFAITTAASQMRDKALNLPTDESVASTSAPLESEDENIDPEWEDVWVKEVQRRDAAARASGAALAEWSEVRARVLSRLEAR